MAYDYKQLNKAILLLPFRLFHNQWLSVDIFISKPLLHGAKYEYQHVTLHISSICTSTHIPTDGGRC
jgi:hypothetical protein